MKISRISLMLLMATSCAIATAQESTSESATQFEDPVFLKVGDEIMNEDGKMMYPSPAMFDVDNDGQDELVIGTIFGGLFACENSNKEEGEPVWEAPTAVNSVDDEPLKLNNW